MSGATITISDDGRTWQLWLPNCNGPAAESTDKTKIEELLHQLENQ